MKQAVIDDAATPAGTASETITAVLLAGGLKPTPLAASVNCSILDLWLTPANTVLDLWTEKIRTLGDINVNVLWNAGTPRPSFEPDHRVKLLEDAAQYRGPAGALRDACKSLTHTLLACEAARYVDADLTTMARAHAASGAAVTVACNPDRSPAGIYLIERPALSLVPSLGFMDLKEQWLGNVVAAGQRVLVHELTGGKSHMLRTLDQFLAAARAANRQEAPALARPSAARMPAGRVVSDLATVHETASLCGSIVMGQAVIERGAIIVRSLIGPGAHVPESAVIVDRVVPARVGAFA